MPKLQQSKLVWRSRYASCRWSWRHRVQQRPALSVRSSTTSLIVSAARLNFTCFHFPFSQTHLPSIQANVATKGFCKKSTSCDINSKPRGNIHRPNTGRKLKIPPKTSMIATITRTANEFGFRNHLIHADSRVGTRRSIIWKYLFSSTCVVAICVPCRGSLSI